MEESKRFEDNFSKSCERLNICHDRLVDNMSGMKGQNSICDFIVFFNMLFYLELKTCKTNDRFNFSSNIRKNQYNGLEEKLNYDKVVPGYIIKYYDEKNPENSKAFFMCQSELKSIPANTKKGVSYQFNGMKSFNLEEAEKHLIELEGEVKRVNFKWHVINLLSNQNIIKKLYNERG